MLAILATVAMAAESPPRPKPADPSPKGSSKSGAESGEKLERQVRQLIEQMGSADYFARQHAQEELTKLGPEAFDILSEATTHDDLEIATRAKYLMRLIRVQWVADDDPLDVKRLLQGYDGLEADMRLARMRALAELPGNKGVPALCRLARFESSPLMSKSAAIELLNRGRLGEAPGVKVAELLRKNLGSSRRPAARWLAIYTRYSQDPAGTVADWEKAVGEEEALLHSSPQQTDPRVAVTMRRMQIAWLEKQGRKADTLAAMRRLIDLEKGDPETFADLVEWLMEQKAWKVLDEVAGEFSVRFAHTPILLYALAQSQAAQGNKRQAEETARQALELNPESRNDALVQHAQVARRLWQRGLFDWAEREYRHVIAKGLPQHMQTMGAEIQLSEMLHDQGHELPAAEVLTACDEALGKGRNGDDEVGNRTVKEIRSRMHYFYACHWLNQGDRAKYREALDAALAAYPADVDVLIACYRVSDATPEYRQKIRELIRKAADELREQIGESGDDSSPMNQFAWLIGNTEGDLDEALKYSKLSIQNSPDLGGYYDTLGRVYYAKGDYASAVEYQTKALELDPHSGLIAKQLALFKKAAEKAPKK